MKAYATRTCSRCGIRDIQPKMIRTTIRSETGRSKRSLTPLTLFGFLLSDKRSVTAVKETIFNSNQRTYYSSRDIWLCEECSGVASSRRKAQEHAERVQQNERIKQEIAAEKDARRAAAEHLRSEEKIAKKIMRRDAHDRYTREKEALKKLAKIASDQRVMGSQRSKDAMIHFSELSKSPSTNDAEARKIKVALRKRPLIFLRAFVEAVIISFMTILVGVFVDISFSNYGFAVKAISFALVVLPIYTIAAYIIRSRRTLVERRRLVQEFHDTAENAASESIVPVENEIMAPQPKAVATSAKKSGPTAINVTLKFEISNGDTYETDEIDIPLVLSDDVSAAWLSKLKIELSDDNLCSFMRHIYGNPDYDGSDRIGVGYDLILDKLSQEVYRNRGWLDARATPKGIREGKKSISLDDDKMEALGTMMIQLSSEGFMYLAY